MVIVVRLRDKGDVMKKLTVLGVSLVAGVVLAGATVAPVAAWHPKGQIKKYVQNVTDGGARTDANDANTAVAAKTGDTLKYTIEISNVAASADNEWNDMHFIELRDTLPVGVELVNDSTKREIKESLGVLKPGQKVTKEYTVKVTSDKDDTVITNKACFTGDSKVKDNKQSGCDNAVVKTDIPQTSSTNTEKPEGKGEDKPEVKAAVTTLPETGMGGMAAIFTGVSGLGYAAHAVVTRKRK